MKHLYQKSCVLPPYFDEYENCWHIYIEGKYGGENDLKFKYREEAFEAFEYFYNQGYVVPTYYDQGYKGGWDPGEYENEYRWKQKWPIPQDGQVLKDPEPEPNQIKSGPGFRRVLWR